eukprot:1052881-Pyramimonas_sp.AAC.1
MPVAGRRHWHAAFNGHASVDTGIPLGHPPMHFLPRVRCVMFPRCARRDLPLATQGLSGADRRQRDEVLAPVPIEHGRPTAARPPGLQTWIGLRKSLTLDASCVG